MYTFNIKHQRLIFYGTFFQTPNHRNIFPRSPLRSTTNPSLLSIHRDRGPDRVRSHRRAYGGGRVDSCFPIDLLKDFSITIVYISTLKNWNCL